MNSLELLRELYSSGTMSKEATVRVLQKRDAMIKTAMIELTGDFFGFDKSASWWGGAAKTVASAPKEPVEKAVSMMRSAKNIAPLLGIAGLVALGTTASRVGLNALGNVHTRSSLKKSYGSMFKEFPELREDKGQASKYFSMMSQYAPALAVNPIVAGTWVRQMMNMNVVDPKNISDLIRAQESWERVQTMKHPLLGMASEIPSAKDMFGKAVAMQAIGS